MFVRTARAFGGVDNFFELGGHSLLAMSVIGRLRKELGIDLQLRTFSFGGTYGVRLLGI